MTGQSRPGPKGRDLTTYSGSKEPCYDKAMTLPLALALALPASALVVSPAARPAGTALVTPAAASRSGLDLSAARGLLSSPASLVGSLPAAQALRLADPDTSRGAAMLAPYAAALAANGNDPMKALLAASRAVSAEAESLTSQTVYPQDGSAALEDLAHRLDEFAAVHAPYLSAARQVELKQAASDLRAAASGSLVDSAQRTAEALGRAQEPGEIAGAESQAKPLPPAAPTEGEVFREMYPEVAGPAPAPKAAEKKGFTVFNVVVYTGGALVMGALGWFLFANLAPAGAGGVLAASGVFAASLGGLGAWLQKTGNRTAAGVLFTAAVSMVPVAVVAGAALFLPNAWDSSVWVFRAAALATIAASVLVARRVRFAFLAMPAALMAWGLSIDAASSLLGDGRFQEWTTAFSVTSAMAGTMLMSAARFIETRTKVDYPFWLYLAGLLAFSGGLVFFPSSGELGRLGFALVHLGLVGVGLYLNRKTFAVFGYLGFNAWVLHMAWRFGETFGFAAGLGGAGLVLILSAVALKKYGPLLGEWLRAALKRA